MKKLPTISLLGFLAPECVRTWVLPFNMKSDTSIFIHEAGKGEGPATHSYCIWIYHLCPGDPHWNGETSSYHPGPSWCPQISNRNVSLTLAGFLCNWEVISYGISALRGVCYSRTHSLAGLSPFTCPSRWRLSEFAGFWVRKICQWKKTTKRISFFSSCHSGCHKTQLIPVPWKKTWTRKHRGGIWKSWSNCWRWVTQDAS